MPASGVEGAVACENPVPRCNYGAMRSAPTRMNFRILSWLALAWLLVATGRSQTPTGVFLDREGNLRWQLDFSSGLLSVESMTNLASPRWIPRIASLISTPSGSLALQAKTNIRTEFFRVKVHPTAGNPAGMRLVPEGEFLMGDDNLSTYAYEKPAHWVYISRFYVDPYEVTNEQMREMLQWALDNQRVTVSRTKMVSANWGDQEPLVQCRGTTDAIAHNEVLFTNNVFQVFPDKDQNPCVGISWYGAVAFCNWRSERAGLEPCYNLTNWTCDFTKPGFRLPTEAEWEKAARGGRTGHNFPWESPSSGNNFIRQINTNLATYTPVGLPHPFRTTPVGYYNGSQEPAGPDTINGYGLYDVVGNVREWCWDWLDPEFYAKPEASLPDPTGPGPDYIVTFPTKLTGPVRASRGGSFDEPQKNVRSAYRGQDYQSSPEFTHWYHGMRCVRRVVE